MREESLKAIRCGKLINGTGANPVRDATVLVEVDVISDVGRGIDMPDEAEVVEVNCGLQPNSLGLP